MPSRPRSRRLTVMTVAAGLLAGAAMPALAATDTTKVTYVVPDGTRQFKVTEVDGVTPLADFTFDTSRQKPFRTVVNDVNRPLLSDGYQVNAEMTNLYRVVDASHDFESPIPAKNLTLTYGSTPLAGTATLPVLPRISLVGVIGTCADGNVAAALGIPVVTSVAPLDPVFALLSPLMQTVCTELNLLSGTARTVDVTVDGVLESITAALSLSDLPFTLTGGEGGRFTNPSFDGPIASLDPAATGATAATAKRVMTGNPLATIGDVTRMLESLTAALVAALPSTLIASDNSGVATLTAALAAISAENAPLVSTISRLNAQDQLDMLALLTQTLLDVDMTALTTTTAQYDAYPVLQVAEYAAQQGVYEGTLVVDFFETGTP
ncbi:MAG: hypothetical protein ACYDAN_16730 [Candidatus Limnocylindrales bacterium]